MCPLARAKKFWRKLLSKNFADFFFEVEKRNVGDHVKRVSPKFEAERSHPRGVNSCSKFRIFQKSKTLNGRLPPEIRSYSRENLGETRFRRFCILHFLTPKIFGARCAVAMGAAAAAAAGTKRNKTEGNGR